MQVSETVLNDSMNWLVVSLELNRQIDELLKPSRFWDDPVNAEKRLRVLVRLLACKASMLPAPGKGVKPAWDDFIDRFQQIEACAHEHRRVFEVPEDITNALSAFDTIAMAHMRLNKSPEWIAYDQAMAEHEAELYAAEMAGA